MTNYITSVGVQQFSITIAALSTTGTATINAVGLGAFIVWGGINPSVSADPEEAYAYLTLTNNTTITATRSLGTTGTVIITGSIVDGDTTNLIKSVQFGTITMTTGQTSNTATVTAVTDANAAIVFLGTAGGDATVAIDQELVALTQSGTTVTATRSTAGGNTSQVIGFQLIEFQGSALTANKVQRVSATSSSSVTSFTASFPATTLANTLTFWGGSEIASIGTNLSSALMNGVVTSGTLTVNVNTATANAKTYNASIVEFNSGVLNSAVQRATKTLTGVATGASTITGITAANGGVSFLGNTTSVTSALEDQGIAQVALTNGTTVTTTKVTATGNVTASFEVFEFPAYSAGVAQAGDAIWFGMTF